MAANTERNGISSIERIANKERRGSSGNIDRDEQVNEYEEVSSKKTVSWSTLLNEDWRMRIRKRAAVLIIEN